MKATPLERIERIFHEALEHPPEDRPGFLDAACADDDVLRSEVQSLLGAFEPSADYFDDLADSIAAGAHLEIDHVARPRVEVGVYRAIRPLGHGGMGAVYLAERTDGQFDQSVALKLLHLDMQQPAMRARFLAERQLLARLSHANIARLLDGGLTEEGRPYFVMEYVDGIWITDHCRQQALGLEAILRLFLELVEAVGYLHHNLVVHRDLKPSNILVDEEGHVRLLDFGIAKLLDDEGDAAVHRTVTAERLLTPAYAAPEQASDGAITTSTDVYSLGALLYELLTGTRHRDTVGDSGAPHNIAVEPPSSRLRRLALSSGDEGIDRPNLSWKEVAGDLDTICRMALRSEPERRYSSAEQLGEDIERYLRGLPVRARKSTLGYRLGKWLGRHRLETAASVALLVLLALGFVRERSLRDVAERAESVAQEEAMRAVAVSDFLGELLASLDPRRAQGRDITVAEILEDASERLDGEHALAGHAAAEAEVRLTLGRTYTSLSRWDEADRHLQRALELRRPLGDELARLEVVEALGVLAYRSARHDEAEQQLREALQGRQLLLGEEHPDTLETMGHLANLYWYMKELDKAEQLDRQTLAVRRRVLGPDHPETLKAVNSLATTLYARAHYAEAAQFFQQALAGQEPLLGPDHPDTLRTKNNLAATYSELGRSRESLPLQWDVAEGRARVLGERSADTATAWHNLGITLYRLGRYDQAEEQLSKARDLRRELARSASSWLFTQSFLADVYRDSGRIEAARALYLESLEGQVESLGADHPETLRTEIGLAGLELRQNELAAAETRISRVVEIHAEALEEGQLDALAAAAVLCGVRVRQGRAQDAHELADRAIAAGVAALGEEHPALHSLRLQKARAWLAEGRREDAGELLVLVERSSSERLGPEHPLVHEAAALRGTTVSD